MSVDDVGLSMSILQNLELPPNDVEHIFTQMAMKANLADPVSEKYLPQIMGEVNLRYTKAMRNRQGGNPRRDATGQRDGCIGASGNAASPLAYTCRAYILDGERIREWTKVSDLTVG